jgi:uncharacterized membrane protein YwzB
MKNEIMLVILTILFMVNLHLALTSIKFDYKIKKYSALLNAFAAGFVLAALLFKLI